ncbi:nitrous oxide reductase family maturation protein NosD [Mesobacillus boroniphilus]|uniref:Nitrous oxide reductase family maturation protein NosD n=1 Tax=Mesobacillus boroniphilus TaxID=308892 RepID=A0A944GWZ4_9BACI|nr:nitrous oxide reductase family maturation protein NosD [Mesobacillus boroniphilus]MBS8265478.1 nitrous oxide reductase family maturation protein NosD [Mesobacillus boroniphilus]
MKKFLWLLLLFSAFTFPEKGAAAENLQAVINSAKDGAVIKLENKIYTGNIVIDKPLTLVGKKGTVIEGDGKGNVISVRAPGVTVSNLDVRKSGMSRNSSEEYAAIKVYTDGNIIRNIWITQSFHGVYLSKAHNNTIENVRVKGLGKGEIAAQGNGLHVYYSNGNLLKNNYIEGTRDGMFFDYANDNKAIGNEITKTRYGLHYMYSDRNEFKNNIFTFNTGGAAIMHSSQLKLANNQFIFNYGHRSFGLLVLSANENKIENNTFYMNQRGLYIDQSTDNLIRSNRISQNQIGIELWASSNEQVFTENTIEENTIPAVALGGKGRNNWSKEGTGNYWGSTFPLLDLDQDGVGDSTAAYKSSLYELIEEQELVYLFLKSPAIKIYEKLNRLLDQEKVMFEDQYPLVDGRKQKSYLPFLIVTAVLITAIFAKRRKLLCILFGRNGRKI